MREFNCITVQYYKAQELLIWKIRDTGMPNFCLKGLQEFAVFSEWVETYFKYPDRPLKFIVSASEHQGIYNMGGDLPFFLEQIKTGQIEQLRTYAHLCVDAIHTMYTGFNLPVITIALVEGNAYGGGFECALAHDYVMATENAQFCLPENKFNLFPGMGAYSLLTRKLNKGDANTILKEDNMYTAHDLESLGLVTKVIKKNEAEHSLYAFIQPLITRFNFERHHIQCQKMINPLEKKELIDITDLWVEACLQVDTFDLRKMEILGKAQSRRKEKV